MASSVKQNIETLAKNSDSKVTKKEAQNSFEVHFFFKLWNELVIAKDPEQRYYELKQTSTVKKYIENSESIEDVSEDGFAKVYDFSALNIFERFQLYNKVLDKVYKQFSMKKKQEEYFDKKHKEAEKHLEEVKETKIQAEIRQAHMQQEKENSAKKALEGFQTGALFIVAGAVGFLQGFIGGMGKKK